MERQVSSSGTKRHSRHVSHNRALLTRKTTTGPLDGDDPLADDSESPASTTPKLSLPSLPTPTKPLSPEADLPILTTPAKDFSYLLRPEIYHPLTQFDVPPAFHTAPHIPDITTPLSTLLAVGHFRLAATKSAALLTSQSAPVSASEIFALLYTRLSCLTLINATALAAQEAKCLEDLSSAFYRDAETGTHIVPWELRVLTARLLLVEKQGSRAVMAYYDLARDARLEIGKAKGEERAVWKARLADLGLRVANALIEMGDLIGACRHLESLRIEGQGEETMMRDRLGLLWLQIGNLKMARRYIANEGDLQRGPYADVLLPLLTMAEGDHKGAATQYAAIRHSKAPVPNSSTTQNLAVCLLYTGKIKEARSVLESLISEGCSFPTLLFNLSTVFELCTDRAKTLKIELAERLARVEGTETGWERSNTDFKL